MKTAKITINDKEFIVSPDKTILQVIEENKIDNIPTLCHDPKLPPYGSCYLCVVEVEGLNRLVPSCCSPVTDGMKIHTNSEKINTARKMALELLLSNHYADCIAPCKKKCPAGVDVQGYIALTSMGKFSEAVKLIKEKNPLPLVCGRVCVRECEISCRRNKVDEAVGIDYLKRYSSDVDMENPWIPEVPRRNGKKVAIVGGGPAGLSCGYYLVLKGYSVTIFERWPELGGMLKYGIPEYRLPKKVLDREIKWITDLGIEVKTDVSIGEDFTIDSLLSDGFSAVFLALGAQKANKMQVPEEETTDGIISGIKFLADVEINKKSDIHGKVVVVGGGNTAIDAARTSLRCGAEKVTILYRRTRKEMPANDMEIEASIHEGVEMIYLSAPVKIIKENGRLKGLECIKMGLGEPDASGRRRPVPLEGSEYILPCDFAISAIGQGVEPGKLKNETRLKLTKWGTPETNMETFETSFPGVFSGGDMATGPAVAIDAIAHGKSAADAIDEYIKTGKASPVKKDFVSCKDIYGEIPEAEFSKYEKSKRQLMPELPPEERIKSFEEVELGYSSEQASLETLRCLECGCSYIFDCKLKEYATEYGVDISRFIGEVNKYEVDGKHPFINLDPNKCISCGRCVRTCSGILNVSALGFIYRGFKSVVKPAMEKPLSETTCISCGNCIATCPTGAITEKLPFPKPAPWLTSDADSICSFCSVGCNLKFKVLTDDIFYVANPADNTHNNSYLCHKGRFGYRYLLHKERLLNPLIKKDGELKEVNWNEAIEEVSVRLKTIIDKYGPDAVALFASPKMTNEELYLLQKFARCGLKTNNIHSFSNMINSQDLNSLDETFGITVSTASQDEISKSNVVLVINSDLTNENLIMELKIKEAQRKGAKIIVFNSSETDFTKGADLWIDSKRGSNTFLLNGIMEYLIKTEQIDKSFIECLTSGYEAFKESLDFDFHKVSGVSGVEMDKLQELAQIMGNRDLNLMVVYNIDYSKEKSKNDLKAIGNFLLLTGRIGKPSNGLIIVRNFANSLGLLDMGVIPDYLPGYVKYDNQEQIDNLGKYWGVELKDIFRPVNLSEKMLNKEIKAALIFGEDPLIDSENIKYLEGCEFVMVQDIGLTKTAQMAKVVLPSSTYIESGGSFTACDRKVQRFKKIFEPKTSIPNWEVIKKISEKLDFKLDFSSLEEIFNEIKEVNNLYMDIEIFNFWSRKLFDGMFPSSNGKGTFQLYPVDLNPEKSNERCYLFGENYIKSRL